MCIYVFIQVIYLIAVNIFHRMSVCVNVCAYTYIFRWVWLCVFSVFQDLWMCYRRMNHWPQPDKRWVDINQYNWLPTEHRGQRSSRVSPTLAYTVLRHMTFPEVMPIKGIKKDTALCFIMEVQSYIRAHQRHVCHSDNSSVLLHFSQVPALSR